MGQQNDQATLPIEDVLEEVLDATRDRGVSVLVAPPGAGKTTRVPPALLRAGLGPVVVLEPRRIAARAAARRVAEENGWKLGEEVGYHVRFDRKAGPKTQILFCTEGILLAQLQDDPFLEGVGCIVFDEFHERSLEADLALAMARRVREEAREDLRLIATSATLQAEPIAAFLGGAGGPAPIVASEGRLFPVEVDFVPPERGAPGGRDGRDSREALGAQVQRAVRQALERSGGDVLVFLAGVGEIRRCGQALGSIKGVDVVELYGDLPPEKQDAALREGPRRRVVLSTNVAESSVTVAGVRAVVDSGEARVMRHEPGAGIDRLKVERIDRAAADQRAGRAGRLGPGLCLRLWSAVDDRNLEPALEPEVRRLDVAGAVLQLALWGESDVGSFPWFEAPRAEATARALELLGALGALDGRGQITGRGRALARLPLHPRLAALVHAGAGLGVAEEAALAAAMLSERDPFRTARGPRAARPDATESDLFERVAALRAFESSGRTSTPMGELVQGGARRVLRARDQILRRVRGASGGETLDAHGAEEALARAVHVAFSDRLCRRRAGDGERAVMAGGRGVRLARECGVTEAELFVAIQITAGFRRGDEDLVRMASAVEREWIDGGEVRVETVPVFDPRLRRVVGRRRELLGPLLLAESDHPVQDAPAAEAALLEAAREDLSLALGLDREEVSGVVERIRFLRAHAPELELPEPDEAAFEALLPMLVPGRRSFVDLQKAPVVEVMLGGLTHAQRVGLDTHAPERVQVPSGSRLRLLYDGERAPVLAVRIQEMFGLPETPRVARGKVPVLLHLLAPNGRPQQVTDDLASFWKDAYHHVRKDLRTRYPKHDWPEDALSARPSSRPRRRRRR
jgi:ATP-dependent helicase HrpB